MASIPQICILALSLSFYNCVATSSPTIQWAWMRGNTSPRGVYGQKGVPSTTNVPHAEMMQRFGLMFIERVRIEWKLLMEEMC